MEIEIKITENRPFFAEIPYYLWGEVHYDSDGDCKNPTDQNWHNFYLRNRDSGEEITINGENENFTIESEDESLIYRTILILKERSKAEFKNTIPYSVLSDWDHTVAVQRSQKVIDNFENNILKPFDDMVFWGSWKWIGKFSSEFTWVGRWIMNSLVENDTRAVYLCAWWMKDGAHNEVQSKALLHALKILSGEKFKTEKEWLEWYFKGEGTKLYPEPNMEDWQNEKSTK